MKASPQTLFAVGASIVVLAVVTVGLILNGSPADVRRERLDQARVSDLRRLSDAIDSSWRSTNRLPENLNELARDQRWSVVSSRDQITGRSYDYRVTGADTYELCAEFDAAGSGAYGFDADDPFWQHGEGRHCFAFTARPLQMVPVGR